MLELAHECKQLKVFSHVSTAYVNSNVLDGSKIEEKVYDLPNGQDPEEVVRQIIRMGPQSVTEQEKSIIGAYPNTYTFTKGLAERMLKKNRGNLPIVIMRPSIIQGNYDEPLQGWTDTVSASGFFFLMVCLGHLNFVHAKLDTVLDVIPCDFVSNQLLVQSVYAATSPPDLHVAHAASSVQNPLKITDLADIILDNVKYNPFLGKPENKSVWWQPVGNLSLWQFIMYLNFNLPIHIGLGLAKVRGRERDQVRFR